MKYPEWIDREFSEELPVLISKGEGQNLEFKERFPVQAQKLGEEIAAFATTNPGIILLGVTDEGEVVGITGLELAKERDNYTKRIEGICNGTVKPAITPSLKFALFGDKVVIAIMVPKGRQPVYYCNFRPYIRHIRESRAAEPNEVIELIENAAKLKSLSEESGDELGELLSILAESLGDVIIFGEELEQRSINPWFDIWRSIYQDIANNLRKFALEEAAIKNRFSSSIKQLANDLDKIANFRMAMGEERWREFEAIVNTAIKKSYEILKRCFEGRKLTEEYLIKAKAQTKKVCMLLSDLNQRGEQMIDQGRSEEFQSEVSSIGHALLLLSFYPINALKRGLKEDLREIGRYLHLIETHRIYLDGGVSLKGLLDKVSIGKDKLEALVGTL